MIRMTPIFLIFMIALLAACAADGAVVVTDTAVSPATSIPEGESLPTIEPILEPTNTVAPTSLPESTATLEVTAVSAPKGPADANVEYVRAVETAENRWTFHVTVAHPDTGWEDYADGWDVVLPDGTVLLPDVGAPFTRLLLHPHETEQPFTRSQSNLEIPTEVTAVTVRAHDIVDGFGGLEIEVDLTQATGENYEVQRINE